jgi:hypothetical protein
MPHVSACVSGGGDGIAQGKSAPAPGQFTSLTEALRNPDVGKVLILDKMPLTTLPLEIVTLQNLSV